MSSFPIARAEKLKRTTFRRHLRSFQRMLLSLAIGMACYLPLAAAGAGKNIEQTAANRICVVLIGFVVFSLGLEVGIEKIEEYYEEQNREGMVEVIGKIKEEFGYHTIISTMKRKYQTRKRILHLII